MTATRRFGVLTPSHPSLWSRLSRIGNRGARCNAWQPLTLRWRRQVIAPQRIKAIHVSRALRAFWTPQFHLHFVTRPGERTRGGALVAGRAEAMQQTTLVNRHYTTVKGTMPEIAPRRTQTLRVVQKATGPAVASVPRTLLLWPSMTGIAPCMTSGARASMYARAANVARLAAGKREDRRPDPVVQRGRSIDAKPFSQRPLALVNRATALPVVSPAPYAHFERQPELVWRREAQVPQEPADSGRPTVTVESPLRTQASSYRSQEATSGASVASSISASQPVTKIDARLLDRLADDVIRRVERRVRIERERRGI